MKNLGYNNPDKKYESKQNERDKQDTREENKENKELHATLEALASLGDEAKIYKDEYGIDPARILSYRKDAQGSIIFLCRERTQDGRRLFYVLRASKKTEDLKKLASEYKKD